jgi:phosphatidylinositol kinase/protein kinase (PI-3  family)
MAENHKVRILELANVSPYLSDLRNTAIGIPGYHKSDNACFIDTFGQSVIILPTKTKPKKLNLVGTDGRKYSYLFKGLEDLHLDERIMQLLNTTNGLLSEDGTSTTTLRGLRARTYAVIPLSDHSGMIQWVNEATPMFALFKKWQKRESATHMLLTNDKPNEAYMRSLMQRPTENFTQKVTAALKHEKLRVTANRRYWPKHILKKVYLELVKETPGDLLEKEIWYSSTNATEWFKKSTSFARSLAVASIIGYIIGLGDRHLDNMLIDFKSGEIIHIDYNVCFEKGKRLRVPELVPYRLTQNLYGALGIMGTEGPFRVAAEETLRVLRKNKEVLITLLDAFVYDPLVDWESEAEEAGHRQMMELQANLWLIAARVVEKQDEYDVEQLHMQKTLAMIQNKLQIWQQTALLEAESLDDDEASDEDEVDPSLTSDNNSNNVAR